VIISNTGYTGAGGFELYVDNGDAVKLWEIIFETGSAFDIKPAGLGARDTLRLEMGYCLYGNDIDDTTSPIEAGLGWITKFNNHKDFIDKELLWQQKMNGTKRKLKGFEMCERAIPRHGYDVVDANENVIGIVTSGTMSPVLQKGIGLAYINEPFTATDTEIFIKVRQKSVPAKIVKLPFVKGTI
jgi:aminomethyltransferase